MDISSVNSTVRPLSATEKTTPVQTPEQASDRAKLVKAVKAVNESSTLGENNELTFIIDRTTHRALTRVIDRKTKEVVMQIPPESVIRMAEELKQNSAG